MTVILPRNQQENQFLMKWVGQHIPHSDYVEGSYQCIGFTVDDDLAAAAIFYDYRKPNICMAFASQNPRWATRTNIEILAGYPFRTLGCTRITALCNKRNKRIRRFIEGIGFEYEGNLRGANPQGDDVLIYGLLRKNWYDHNDISGDGGRQQPTRNARQGTDVSPGRTRRAGNRRYSGNINDTSTA